VDGNDPPVGPPRIQALEQAEGGHAAGWIEIREPGVVGELGASPLSLASREEKPSRLEAPPGIVGMGVRHPECLGQVLARTPRRPASQQSELRVGFEVEGIRAERPFEVFASCGFAAPSALQAGKEHQRSRLLRRPFENLASEAPGRVPVAATQGHPGQPEARRGRLPIRLEGAEEAPLREVDLAAREGLLSELHEGGRGLGLGVAGSGLGELPGIARRAQTARRQRQWKSEAQANQPPEALHAGRLSPARLPHHERAFGWSTLDPIRSQVSDIPRLGRRSTSRGRPGFSSAHGRRATARA